jgi:hypothetical protein
MRLMLLLACAAALGASACREVDRPPDLPAGVRAFTPPAVYTQWWGQVETCAARTADFSRVRWFELPNAPYLTYRGVEYDGYWWSTHWILLAGDWEQKALIVRHEMLHDVLGTGHHPAEFFQRRCATVVICDSACRADDQW